MKRKREREYFNGKDREKLNKIYIYFFLALELQCTAIWRGKNFTYSSIAAKWFLGILGAKNTNMAF